MDDWAVYRVDFHANEFLVEKGLSKEKADELAAHYIALGHHQHYWVDKQPAEKTDFSQLLEQMVKSGSSQNMAIRVLLSQGATEEDCIDALASFRGESPASCRKLIRDALSQKGGNNGLT